MDQFNHHIVIPGAAQRRARNDILGEKDELIQCRDASR
jgi:hypothetical protein